MTEQQFLKYKFSSYESITCTFPETQNMHSRILDCMLLGIDFEQKLFKLIPFDSFEYEDEPFWARYEYCEKTISKLKFSKTTKKSYDGDKLNKYIIDEVGQLTPSEEGPPDIA